MQINLMLTPERTRAALMCWEHRKRSHEEVRVEEELQQISVELEPKCDVEIIAPEEDGKEEAASSACAIVTSTATIEVETASQASEPASQASDEDDVPVTDIYF
ncbi:phosphatidylinositol 4-phosphate 5-kinase type-1 gamma-like [Podargus strigoides]